jgi:ribose 1,5-bisphosphokinase
MVAEVQKKGVLILVAGPSGSGKDTLIAAARRTLAGDPGFVFPMRLITRADQCGEEHVYVPASVFEASARNGGFFLHWEAHGFRYGIPGSVRAGLEAGRSVIFNISRRMIPKARELWQPAFVVSISVAGGVLRDRLRLRARETEAQIEERVRRASAIRIAGPYLTIENSGGLGEATAEFVTLLTRLRTGAETEAVAADQFEHASALRFA